MLLLPYLKKIKVLNRLGSRTWSLINGKRTVSEIAATLSEDYQVAREVVEADTVEFLRELHGFEAVTFGEAVLQEAGKDGIEN